MKTLLYISASARKFIPTQTEHQSISKMLATQFISTFKQCYSETEVIHRDLSQYPPAFIDETFIGASFAKGELTKAERAALKASDQLIDEVERADVIVIASPMYNYGMPAVLKAWFDQIIRINKTFSFDLARGENPIQPILSGKQVVLLSSWGEFNFKKGESKYAFNHLSSHIEQLAPYLGADQFYEVASEYQEFGDERHQRSKKNAVSEAELLASKLATS